MNDILIIIFFCCLTICLICFLFYFACLIRHILAMKRNSDFMAHMQMHPVQPNRFSDGEEFEETDMTTVFVPSMQPDPNDYLYTQQMTRTHSSFFQLPLDSYYKFSLVDEYLGTEEEIASVTWAEIMSLSSSRISWERIAMRKVVHKYPERQNPVFSDAPHGEDITDEELAAASSDKEYLI